MYRLQASGFGLQVKTCGADHLKSGAGCARFQRPQGVGEEPPADAGGLRSHHSVSQKKLCALAGQVRKPCAAVPANIAEGCGRDINADLARFLRMALGSASELQCHLLLARDLSYLNPRDHERLIEVVTEIKRMLTPFIKNPRAFAKPETRKLMPDA